MVAGRCGVATPVIILTKHLIQNSLREEVYLAHGSDAKVHHGGADIGDGHTASEGWKQRGMNAGPSWLLPFVLIQSSAAHGKTWAFIVGLYTLTPLWKHHKVTPRASNLMSVADLS